MLLPPLKPSNNRRADACRTLEYIGLVFILAGTFILIMTIKFWLFPPAESPATPTVPASVHFAGMAFTASLPTSMGALAFLCAQGIRRKSRFWLKIAITFTFFYTALFIVLGMHMCVSSKFAEDRGILVLGMSVLVVLTAKYHFTLVLLQREEKGLG